MTEINDNINIEKLPPKIYSCVICNIAKISKK